MPVALLLVVVLAWVAAPANCRSLVFTAAGGERGLASWLSVPPSERTYDVAVVYYHDVVSHSSSGLLDVVQHAEAPRYPPEYKWSSKGTKLPLFVEFVAEANPSILEKYDSVWLPDADLIMARWPASNLLVVVVDTAGPWQASN